MHALTTTAVDCGVCGAAASQYTLQPAIINGGLVCHAPRLYPLTTAVVIIISTELQACVDDCVVCLTENDL